MKYLIILCLFLIGCDQNSAEKLNLRVGDVITVKRGFYKNCTGILVDYIDYDAYPDFVELVEFKCENDITTVINDRIRIKVEDIK